MTSRSIQDRGAASARNRLLAAAQHGDLVALEQLARLYEPLIQRVVWKLKLPPGCEREDLAQEARVGLLAAIRAWRPERGPFPAFADRCVSNQALLALEAAAAQQHQVLSRTIPLDAPQEGAAAQRSPQRAGDPNQLTASCACSTSDGGSKETTRGRRRRPARRGLSMFRHCKLAFRSFWREHGCHGSVRQQRVGVADSLVLCRRVGSRLSAMASSRS